MIEARVSVVIATYNRSMMVCEAVKSAWNQTLRPHEIVVSDDCSTDDTLEALERLRAEIPGLTIVRNDRNSGGVPNWNKVINSSSGDLIAWCSDDDRLDSHHLENAVTYLFEHPDVALVHACFTNVTEYASGEHVYEKSPLKASSPIEISHGNVLLYSSTNFNWPFHPSTLVFRRELWLACGEFNPAFALADTEWFIRCARTHKLVYLPYYGAVNRRHLGDSGNWSNRVGSVRMQRELRESIFDFYKWAKCEGRRDFDVDRQLAVWLRRYRVLLLRMFVARSRAGALQPALDIATEICAVTPSLTVIPSPLGRFLVRVVFSVLSFIQTLMPGGRSKYQSLGKHVPL